MLEKLYKRALDTHNKKLLAIVLSSLVGLSGCTTVKDSDKNLDGTIYGDKFIVDVTNNSDIKDVLKDKNGYKLNFKDDIDCFIVDEKTKDGTWKVTIVSAEGNVYEGLIEDRYITDLNKRLKEDYSKDKKNKEDYNNYLLSDIPGSLFEYGPGNYKDYKEYFYDEDDDEIDFRTKKIAITKDPSYDSKIIKYLAPGDMFVLLPDGEVFKENVFWNRVAILITNEVGQAEVVRGYINGTINLSERFYFKYLGTNDVKKNKNK